MKMRWETTSTFQDHRNKTHTFIVTASVLAGIQLQKLRDFLYFLGAGEFTNSAYFSLVKSMKKVFLFHQQVSIKRALQQAKGHFAFDFRWAKRRQAKLGTGAILDANTHKVVEVCRYVSLICVIVIGILQPNKKTSWQLSRHGELRSDGTISAVEKGEHFCIGCRT